MPGIGPKADVPGVDTVTSVPNIMDRFELSIMIIHTQYIVNFNAID